MGHPIDQLLNSLTFQTAETAGQDLQNIMEKMKQNIADKKKLRELALRAKLQPTAPVTAETQEILRRYGASYRGGNPLDALLDALGAASDATQQLSFDLQAAASRQAQAATLMSQILKTQQNVVAAVIRNIRG
jgi:hypothetical protein